MPAQPPTAAVVVSGWMLKCDSLMSSQPMTAMSSRTRTASAMTRPVVISGPWSPFQQRPASGMVLVGAVGGGHQRASVDDQH